MAPIELDFPPGSLTAATGNGVHGIQLQNGRLLIQGGYSERVDGRLQRRCCVFTSDDLGETWRRILDFDTARINVIREFVMAEKSNGDLYINIRSTQSWRAIYSGNKLQDDDELGDIQCHAGLGVWQRSGRSPLWVFSSPNPQGEARTKNFNQRRQRLTLRLSNDEGATWPREILIHKMAAAYSDVAIGSGATALVIFENGDRIGHPYQRISLARIPL